MGRLARHCIAALFLIAPLAGVSAACPPDGWSRERLETLKAAGFEIEDAASRDEFAEAVIACVASPDPFLRDGVAFEAVSHMLRADRLATEVKRRITRDLLTRIGRREPGGFEAPFAALLLAEIARADGLAQFLSSAQRDEIATAAIHYVVSLRDYRGYDEREGWRHGVAHGADLLMQLARNPHLTDRARLTRIRDAVEAQVAPAGHFYIYGEPERLMQPVIMLARRGIFTQAEWSAWFARLAAPAPLASWDDAFRSQSGLARRHDLRAFFYAVWLNARLSADSADDILLPGAEAALRTIP